MSQQPEKPFGGIVDTDTFGYYVIGYTSRVMQAAPRQPISETLWMKRFTDPISGLSPERSIESPYLLVRLEQCPWNTVPASIQKMIKQLYLSKDDQENQYIEVTISRRDIVFALYNNFIEGRINKFAEEYVSRGLLLLFVDEPDAIVKKGEWRIARFPLSLYSRLKYATLTTLSDFESIDKLTQQLESLMERIPSTLGELRDIARFLEDAKERAVVYTPKEDPPSNRVF